MSRTPPETATSRVQRLLTMVPWLVSRQGIEIADAAAGLGISEAQLRDDLDLLFMVGYGTMPDELVDVSYEAGRVYVGNAEAIARPLRLGLDEAVSLIVGLRALAAGGVAGTEPIERALAKLEAATGGIAGVERVQVAADASVDSQTLATAREALKDGRRVHLTYLVPSRDERTERDVDPLRVTSYDGHWYLEGWCHRAKDVRLFRLDRVEAITVLDAPAQIPEGIEPRDLRDGLYAPRRDDLEVTLALAPEAHWVADYYPVTSRHRESGADGRETLVVSLPSRDEELITRLVLRLGGRARVLAPEHVARAVHERATAALAAY